MTIGHCFILLFNKDTISQRAGQLSSSVHWDMRSEMVIIRVHLPNYNNRNTTENKGKKTKEQKDVKQLHGI